ncbi:MAG: hypothetical protein ACUVRC_09125 [Desulfotomaculales bacterium]
MYFTYSAYKQLISSFLSAGYQVVTVRDYLRGIRAPLTLVLRHDVEWNFRRALAIAEVEKSLGCRSTFYFRVDTRAFSLTAMQHLQREGFEIGYHFNTLDRCNGDFDRAIKLFEKELDRLRKAGINVDTVCSHGDPRVKKVGYEVNNEIFLKDPKLCSRNNLLGEAYLNVNFESLQYISDVGVRWNQVGSTGELIAKIRQKEWPVVYMLTHPDYWSRSLLRAMVLHIAAKSVRRFRINQMVIAMRQALLLPRRLLRGKKL